MVLGGCGRGPLGYYEREEELIERCSAVDFLFVIDNSGSMEPHQQNLRNSFEPFIGGIRTALDDVDDFHVGVVTTDGYRGNTEGCRSVGSLVTSVRGDFNTNVECGPFVEGNRFMTERDDLGESFRCVASVGIEGSNDEQPMRAMERAIDEEQGPWWYDECNAGFVRHEGLLVTVIITDESDGQQDAGSTREVREPLDWFSTVERVKGREENAVMVALVNGVTPECPTDNPVFQGDEIAEFTNMFTHGFVGGICDQDYGDVFAIAVSEIDEACSSFVVQSEAGF